MRILLLPLLTLPFAAHAGGHGAFYTCEAEGMEAFEIEVAAGDCTVDGSKAERTSEDPMVCDFGDAMPGMVTMAADESFTAEMGGETYEGMCAKK